MDQYVLISMGREVSFSPTVAVVPYKNNRIDLAFKNLEQATGQEVKNHLRIANLIGKDFFSWARGEFCRADIVQFEYTKRVEALHQDIKKVVDVVQGFEITAQGLRLYGTKNRELEVSFRSDGGAEVFVVRKQSLVLRAQLTAQQRLSQIGHNELDQNWGLKEYFGTIYLLAGVQERLDGAKQQLLFAGLAENDYEIFPGVSIDEIPNQMYQRLVRGTRTWDGHRPHVGQVACYLAHYRLIMYAKQRFEDALNAYHDAQSNGARENDLILRINEVRRRATILIFEDNVGFGTIENNIMNRDGVGYKFTQSVSDLPDV